MDGPEGRVALGPATRTHRIHLIDEDRGVLGALRIYLLCAGYQVFAAANADEALDRARMATSHIDIIITNLELTRDDDGLAVIDKTRLLLGYNVPAVSSDIAPVLGLSWQQRQGIGSMSHPHSPRYKEWPWRYSASDAETDSERAMRPRRTWEGRRKPAIYWGRFWGTPCREVPKSLLYSVG